MAMGTAMGAVMGAVMEAMGDMEVWEAMEGMVGMDHMEWVSMHL